jgi:tetratricopeptide (TPR) repeat protein
VASKRWEQIESIFLAAVDLPRAEQRAFLEDACRGDDALRREVESLLESDRKSGEKITRAVENEAESLFGLRPIIGTRLGAWRVLSELGRGGMGAVYLATRDDDRFHKNVAIKLLKRGMDTSDVLRRFQHERQILAGLDHVNIARLIDAGTAPDGRPFFVMEYVEGRPIDAYCLNRNLTIAARCRLFLKVCEAVSHAHRHLVVHRDLKPGNIVVAPDGTPKLLDFGVAKLLAPEADPHLTVTGMESRLLTPQYASPEQVTGRPVHTSSDVYSLGAVLYELLTGACAQNIDSTSREDIERIVCLEDAPLPSSVKPGIPADLDNIVMMAMRKDPSRRYHSVDQFAGDIHRYLDGRPVLARKDSLSYRAAKFAGRNRLMLAAVTVVVASLVGGIVIAMSQARRAERRLEQMVELANRSLFDVHTAIERLPGAMDARREIVKTTVAFLENLSNDASRDDDLRLSLATAYWRLGDVQGYVETPNLGDMKGAIESYTKSAGLLQPLRIKRRRSPDVLRQVSLTYQHMGSVLQEMGDTPGMVRAYENAMPEARLLATLRPADVESNQMEGMFYNDLASALRYTDPERAGDYARRHLALTPALLIKFPGNDDIAEQAADAHSIMSALLARSGDPVRSMGEERQSIAIRESLAARHPNDVFRLHLLMIEYGHIGDLLGLPFILNVENPSGAADYFEKCVAIARQMIKANPQDRTAPYDLANSLLRLGAAEKPNLDRNESLAELREASAILESFGKEDPRSLRYQRPYSAVLCFLGIRLHQMWRLDEALVELQRSADVADAILAAHPGDAPAVLRIVRDERETAEILISRGASAGALLHAQRGLSIAQKYVDGPEPSLRLRDLGNAFAALAFVNRALGKTKEAREDARQAIASWDKCQRKDIDPQYRQAAATLAVVK